MLIVGDSTAMRGAIRDFIEVTTSYKACDVVDNDVSAIHKATELRCDLVLICLTRPLQDGRVTVLLLRGKLPQVKIVGFSSLSLDLRNWVSPGIGLDAVVTKQDGLSKLVDTLKALMPEPPQE
jgi:DNA-binding NarL/FixJ family response regulator